MGRPVGGRGHGKVAHGAQTNDMTALHGLRVRGNGGHHAAFAQQMGRVILVFHMHIKGHGRHLHGVCHGRHKPGGKRVGIHTHCDMRPGFRGQAQRLQGLSLAERHLLGVPQQRLPGLGRQARRCAANQHLAYAFFQLLDALRYGGARHMQRAGSALETSFSYDSRKGCQLG